MDFKKEFESRVSATSSFSEILSAFEAIAQIPVENTEQNLIFDASRNYKFFDDLEGQPLFGSFSNFSKKSFCVELGRVCDSLPPKTDIIDFSVLICYPGELWNLAIKEIHWDEQGYDEYFKAVQKTKTFRYLMSHDCRPDFVHVHLEETK